MPGGLIQSVLCDEVFVSEYDRLDEIFYYTMINIKDRLEKTVEVYNPTDPEISLLSAKNHYDKMNNWLSRLSDKLEKLSVLENDDCTYKEAVAAWEEFFKHDFWTELTESLCEYASIQKSGFVERFPELSLFYRLFSPLNSEMICIFPYFCPYAESAREIRGIFVALHINNWFSEPILI